MRGRVGHRGWALLFLAVSVVLVAAGIAVVVADVGQPTEKYYRVNVSVGSDQPFEMSIPGDAASDQQVERRAARTLAEEIDCFGFEYFYDDDRVCALEELLVRSAGSQALVNTYTGRGEQYVYVDGTFYQRNNTRYNDSHQRLRLEQTTAETLAAEIAVPLSEADDNGRTILQQGSVRVPASEYVKTWPLYDTGDGYAMIAAASGERTEAWPPIESLLLLGGLVAFILGGVHATRARQKSFSPP